MLKFLKKDRGGPMTPNKRIGDILIDAGVITSEQLSAVLQIQAATGKKVGELLVEEGFVTEREIMEAVEFQLGIPHVNPDRVYIEAFVLRLINENFARRHVLIPIKKDGNNLTVVMADPLNIYSKEDVQIATGCNVIPAIALSKDILAAIEHNYGQQRAEKAVEDFKVQQHLEENVEEDDTDEIGSVSSAPVVRFINTIMSQAIKLRASDIHLEPYEKILRVRFRVDGELQEFMAPSKAAHSAIVTRLKIMSGMDIAEKRVPQDGRIETVHNGNEVDLRISTLPTVYGEKVVIRILNRNQFLTSKYDLGLTKEDSGVYDNLLKHPHGIIIVAGPTGSGKSTTLYSMLNEINNLSRNIITVEDPVEYKMKGINQVQVNVKAGLTFASGLKSILRQDPDVIMIGEIRDAETAQIAVRAAITGHLVLSSMHTNDAASAVSRLIDLGIEPYLAATSLVGVISQRLVRRICSTCAAPYIASSEDLEVLERTESLELYKGLGCPECNNTGYNGRIATYEILTVNKEVRSAIHNKVDVDELRNLGRANGMNLLRDNCKKLVVKGITTIDEYVKIAYTLDV